MKLLEEDYRIDVAYSGENCGVVKTSTVNTVPLNNLSGHEHYDFVVIISAFIPDVNEQHSRRLFDINVGLVEQLVMQYKVAKIIYCSSVSVYGPTSETILESNITAPANEYAVSKLWAEKIIQRNAKNYVILRISSLIGVGMKGNSFLPAIVNQALSGGKIQLFGNGERKQNYVDAEELSHLIAATLEYSKNNVLLAVSNHSYSNKEMAGFVQKWTNCEIEYSGKDNTPSSVYDNTYTRSELNFSFAKKIEDSIAEIVEWNKKQF